MTKITKRPPQAPPATRHVNLVFQGGGVKGIAYAGVLESMPAHIKIRAVGGTSAGAVVAALLAIGTQPSALQEYLKPEIFKGFLSDAGNKRFGRLKEIAQKVGQAIHDQSSRSAISAAWSLYRANKDIKDIVDKRGLYDTGKLSKWVYEVFGDRRFTDKGPNKLEVDDLKIVAADLKTGSYKKYSITDSPEQLVADAVIASICIPILFEPVRKDPEVLVDGGLLSNFPSYLFEESKYPTIGFCLKDDEAQNETNGFGYLKSLLTTMLTAHDKIRSPANYFKLIPITTKDVLSTKFDLTAGDIKYLLDAGRIAASGVDWEEHTSARAIVRHFDKRPHEALDFVLESTSQLFDTYSQPSYKPEDFDEVIEMTTIIHEDGSSDTVLKNSYQVLGEKPLFCTRITLNSVPREHSILDVKPNVTHQGDGFNLITLPAKNLPNEKGYVLFFSPPLDKAVGKCNWQWTTHIPDDFKKLISGEDDVIFYRTKQRAHIHHFMIEFVVLIDERITSDIAVETEFACTVKHEAAVSLNRISYRKIVISTERSQIFATNEFRVKLLVR
ncbi:patatin-like phospholipase family protein [Tahibacter aquaticus]|nr:patatin-like phospholipase family protein [Tahibacter aquaticus]